MRKSNHTAVRALLREHPDGMTTPTLADILGKEHSSIWRALNTMPDAYIDRWMEPRRGHFMAVWCVVVPPENCPRPDSA
jgi:predicted transcriptional regulator